ncbi:MAG: hypothetical protein MSG78_05890 [Clostridiales bacterium]|nr:hypothetical protein [Clostridiales bacterium]
MNRKKVIIFLNVFLICAMAIHVGVKMYLHGQHPEYSSPVYVELINAVYYLIPLLIINIGNFILKKR